MDSHVADPDGEVLRFERPTRIVHWALAGPFVLLLLTGLTNFFPALKATQFAGERIFAWAHVLLGFASVAAVVAIVLPQLARRAARADLRALTEVGLRDYLWLQHAALGLTGVRSRLPEAGKFNAGQKANALLSFGVTAVLLASGLVLGVNYLSKEVLSAAFVEAVFPWHTWIALLFTPVLLGHLYLALLHPSTRESLRAVAGGRVRRAWAARHHARWLRELDAEGAVAPSSESARR